MQSYATAWCKALLYTCTLATHTSSCREDWRSNRIENKQSTMLLLLKAKPHKQLSNALQDFSKSQKCDIQLQISPVLHPTKGKVRAGRAVFKTGLKSAFGLEQIAYFRKDNDNISPIFSVESITTRYALKGQKHPTSNTMINSYRGKEDRTEYPSITTSYALASNWDRGWAIGWQAKRTRH